jgi:hypothetical protein
MKNNLVSYAIITACCMLLNAITVMAPFTNLHVNDFMREFSIGVGLVSSITVVMILMKKAKVNNA